ncbi:helix-turn-helix domain-containing protein [Bacillus cereus]|uniref:helix-turn-helix domain-containing protein n=1 Tax=Bacillus cereus TaxID=1396 RepID=UPI0018F46F1D|nr:MULTISPECIES: helix-turn-helix transcriptional regulator [Bacillus]MBJ8061888.1 helix-turn-helix domain-containing protein [Bacillus cereus]MCU5108021.1 helix-turn-helix domain-containing protein [Bacillus cereus]
MNKSSFGEELKTLRKRVGMPSKVLSQKVGKAVTYVSQLERELIKNPSYTTCLQILLELGLIKEDAEKMLSYYGIQSKEEKQAELELAVKLDEELSWKINSGYYSKKLEQIERKRHLFLQLIDKQLETLGLFDNSKADIILNNLIELLKSEEKAELLFEFFGNDFSKLDYEEVQLIILKANKEYKKTMAEKFINSLKEE